MKLLNIYRYRLFLNTMNSYYPIIRALKFNCIKFSVVFWQVNENQFFHLVFQLSYINKPLEKEKFPCNCFAHGGNRTITTKSLCSHFTVIVLTDHDTFNS